MDAVWEWKEGEGNMEMMKCVFFLLILSWIVNDVVVHTSARISFFAEKNCYRRPVTSATRCMDGSVQDNKKKKNIW